MGGGVDELDVGAGARARKTPESRLPPKQEGLPLAKMTREQERIQGEISLKKIQFEVFT